MSKDWQVRRWFCPNCGELVFGDGTIKTVCPKCAVEMKMEEKGRRHDILNMYAPKGTERIGLVG